MSASEPLFARTLGADVVEIRPMLEALMAWAQGRDVPQRTIFAMTLVLDELITNTVTHGYLAQGMQGPVDVQVETDGQSLTAVLRDSAPAFDPLSKPEADVQAPLASREIGGLGLQFVRILGHELAYRHIGGHNELRIVCRSADDA